ncbi:trimeric intracellular cation channel family protein [Halobacteriovorax sp. HLS]|uniref:trimeric intracellular cation channel family protein n=1 Tax=Halobacteriovorax sp. HLS TaxID=2234000 RepID=UPI000FDBAB0C|nr:trimeric intracellular cation channel family protein [Halobacteriovorax sp. HLS]
MKELIIILEYIGTFAFAFTGASVAAKSEYDFFGMLFLAFLTAVGGGTIRDMLLDVPVFWTISSVSLYIILIATLLTLFARSIFNKMQSTILLFDTIGLGIFAILGAQKALALNTNIETAIIMGIITGVLGGILRSVFNNEIPIIFKKEVYATTAALCSVAFIGLSYLEIPYYLNISGTLIFCIIFRYSSIRFNIHLPKAK